MNPAHSAVPRASPYTAAPVRYIEVKCNIRTETRRMSLNADTDYTKLRQVIHQRFRNRLSPDSTNLIIHYLDYEGDPVCMESDTDLRRALANTHYLKLQIYDTLRCPLPGFEGDEFEQAVSHAKHLQISDHALELMRSYLSLTQRRLDMLLDEFPRPGGGDTKTGQLGTVAPPAPAAGGPLNNRPHQVSDVGDLFDTPANSRRVTGTSAMFKDGSSMYANPPTSIDPDRTAVDSQLLQRQQQQQQQKQPRRYSNGAAYQSQQPTQRPGNQNHTVPSEPYQATEDYTPANQANRPPRRATASPSQLAPPEVGAPTTYHSYNSPDVASPVYNPAQTPPVQNGTHSSEGYGGRAGGAQQQQQQRSSNQSYAPTQSEDGEQPPAQRQSTSDYPSADPNFAAYKTQTANNSESDRQSQAGAQAANEAYSQNPPTPEPPKNRYQNQPQQQQQQQQHGSAASLVYPNTSTYGQTSTAGLKYDPRDGASQDPGHTGGNYRTVAGKQRTVRNSSSAFTTNASDNYMATSPDNGDSQSQMGPENNPNFVIQSKVPPPVPQRPANVGNGKPTAAAATTNNANKTTGADNTSNVGAAKPTRNAAASSSAPQTGSGGGYNFQGPQAATPNPQSEANASMGAQSASVDPSAAKGGNNHGYMNHGHHPHAYPLPPSVPPPPRGASPYYGPKIPPPPLYTGNIPYQGPDGTYYYHPPGYGGYGYP
ncbi:hypothetical protein H4R33_004068 [Dimargaris cristalligena]|uniref:PB1 domain-containing protein n=1 Tax=Dimargaris cristalligena TaxID=215637 RepID=A0A4P9ZYN9_9FUNG|nr:hypothetical protein H4R33_004068 [Dimargaris cristalligena]RKP38488.1 hypothetical protein BJ085DRAFT_29442 [Dimargaris cristalligena]|eukprot:RKP38488.1 hypothetical protein BJ085DRAFT_29442 [Dimargaris cristalligena]